MLPAGCRLTENRDFRRIYQRGKSMATSLFVLYHRPSGRAGYRVGFSVSKKLGNAVARNLAKRRFREAARANSALFPPGHDYVFILRAPAAQATFAEISTRMAKSLVKLTSQPPSAKGSSPR